MATSADKALGVSELTALIRETLEGGFPSVVVEGELSNCRPASSGHLYFSLKDRASMLQAVMFRYRTRGLGFEPADGVLVRARGSITVYAARGQYQLLAERLERAGEGDILAMLEERKRRLAAEGLFDEGRKRPLPRFPERLAVVTSPTGAAIRDILNVVRRRNAGIDVAVIPAAVQGDEAAAQLVRGIRAANRWKLGDVIIVGRGGGSLEDLLAFSDEEVVRAVASSEIPVVSAVGHETDWSLCDFAADLRAPTPSAAAELVTESRTALAREAAQFGAELATAVRSRLDRARSVVERFEPTSAEARLMRLLLPASRRCDEARDELAGAVSAAIADLRHRAQAAAGILTASSPEAVLARGYAVARRADGTAVRDAAALGVGEELELRFARGRATAGVREVTP